MALTKEELTALETYAAANGRYWKSSLRSDWEAARTRGVLQQLRNDLDFGPSRLVNFRLSKVTSGRSKM